MLGWSVCVCPLFCALDMYVNFSKLVKLCIGLAPGPKAWYCDLGLNTDYSTTVHIFTIQTADQSGIQNPTKQQLL